MFKEASRSRQERAVRSVVHDRRNSRGVDDSVYRDPQDEREILKAQKKETEGKIVKLKQMILEANSRKFTKRPGVDYRIKERWQADLLKLQRISTEIDVKLIGHKAKRRRVHEQKDRLFADAFLEVAKEMLAQPVIDRLVVAAAHRMGSKLEEVE